VTLRYRLNPRLWLNLKARACARLDGRRLDRSRNLYGFSTSYAFLKWCAA